MYTFPLWTFCFLVSGLYSHQVLCQFGVGEGDIETSNKSVVSKGARLEVEQTETLCQGGAVSSIQRIQTECLYPSFLEISCELHRCRSETRKKKYIITFAWWPSVSQEMGEAVQAFIKEQINFSWGQKSDKLRWEGISCDIWH